MTWRTAQDYHKPPVPGRLLGASMVFVLLALLAEYEPARRAALLAAWGFDVAVLFKAGPQALVSTQGFGGPPSSVNRPVRPRSEQPQGG